MLTQHNNIMMLYVADFYQLGCVRSDSIVIMHVQFQCSSEVVFNNNKADIHAREFLNCDCLTHIEEK